MDLNEFGWLIVGAILGMFLMAIISFTSLRNNFHTQAVRHHAAHWITEDNGATNFVWNDENK
jgi:hypothetical protein